MPSHLLLICTFTKHYPLSYAHILFSGRETLISTLNVMAFLYFSTKNYEFLFFVHIYSFWGDMNFYLLLILTHFGGIYTTLQVWRQWSPCQSQSPSSTLWVSGIDLYPQIFFKLLKQKQQQITLATIWTEPSHQLFLRLYQLLREKESNYLILHLKYFLVYFVAEDIRYSDKKRCS